MKNFRKSNISTLIVVIIMLSMVIVPLIQDIASKPPELVVKGKQTPTPKKAPKPKPNQKFHIYINNEKVKFTDELGHPELVNQRTMVPIRIISENMGYEVDWEKKTEKVIITNQGTKVEFNIGNSYAHVNGKKVPMDIKDGKAMNTKAYLRKVKGSSRTMVPLRFISEAFGAKVRYDRANGEHVINITTKGSPELPPIIPEKPVKPVKPGEITFDKAKDTLPDGRMTEEKTEEYLKKAIENIQVYTKNGKHYFKYDKVDAPEGFIVAVSFDVSIKHTSNIDGIYLSPKPFINLKENTIPANESFTKELRGNAMRNSNLMMLNVAVVTPNYKGQSNKSSVTYRIDYNPKTHTSLNTIDRNNGITSSRKTYPFDKNLIFKDLKIK